MSRLETISEHLKYCSGILTPNPEVHKVTDQVSGLDACVDTHADPQKVDATKERLLSLEEANEVALLFRLLGDPNRARMLYALLEAGELCVCDLAETVDASETTVSHALRLLRTAGVVRHRRAGRMIFYSLDDDHVRLLLGLTREHLRHA